MVFNFTLKKTVMLTLVTYNVPNATFLSVAEAKMSRSLLNCCGRRNRDTSTNLLDVDSDPENDRSGSTSTHNPSRVRSCCTLANVGGACCALGIGGHLALAGYSVRKEIIYSQQKAQRTPPPRLSFVEPRKSWKWNWDSESAPINDDVKASGDEVLNQGDINKVYRTIERKDYEVENLVPMTPEAVKEASTKGQISKFVPRLPKFNLNKVNSDYYQVPLN